MRRWAVLCTKQMTIIPPHPSQLSQLILLKSSTERQVCIFFYFANKYNNSLRLLFRLLKEKEKHKLEKHNQWKI